MKTIRLKIEERAASNLIKIANPVCEAVRADKTFKLVINLDDNQFYLVSGSRRKADKVILTLNFKGWPDTEKGLSKARGTVRNAIRDYDHNTNITLSTVLKEYGKKGVLESAFTREADNPYYKCAAPMRLYNRDVIEYQLAKVG